jgi:tetratricopeptide (TPR) repeat protein
VSQTEAQRLPDVWNVPLGRNPNFTGRVDEIDRLRQSFARRVPRTPFQAIHGLGGIGKTQLALEYAYRFAADYDVVWWVRAEEPATLAADLADLAVALRLPGSVEPDQRAALEAVKQWLQHKGRWLLVFDSVKDPQDVQSYLPPSVLGHVLVTSRHASWGGVALPLPLPRFKRSEAVALLLARSGAGADQEAPARELAAALGDLPLALAQAAAYVEEAGTSIAEYLTRFRERRAELMKRGAEGESAPTVATTWGIAFRDAQTRSPAAGELLDLCAFLAPDDIPRDALRLGAERFPPALAAAVSDPLALDEAVKALRRYSLIDVQEDALSVHRLVQAAVRDRLGEGERAAWAELAVAFACEVFPDQPDHRAQRGACRRWLPHARAALENARAAAVPPREPTERLLRHAAVYQYQLGFEQSAREMLEQALALAESIHGPDHAHVAMALTNLGTVLMNLNDLDGALRHARRALDIDVANHGEQSPIVATDANNLACVLKACNALDEARRQAERALAIDEAQEPVDEAAVARDANNLGSILRELDDLAGARRLFERALAIDERLGSDDRARDLNNLGALLREMGELGAALEHAERALAIGKETYGSDDPNVATFHSNLASVLQELGLKIGIQPTRDAMLSKAQVHLEEALEIGEKIHGPEHYVVAIRRNNLGVLLKDRGKFPEAREQLQKAVAIARKVLGPQHRRVKKLENNLEVIEKHLAAGKTPR